MTDTTIPRPTVWRTVDLLEHGRRPVHHVPLDSEVGRRNTYDVRLGVGFAPDIAGAVLSFEDDPVILVVVNATIPARFWEAVAEVIGQFHQRNERAEAELSPQGGTYWSTWAAMPQAWKDGLL